MFEKLARLMKMKMKHLMQWRKIKRMKRGRQLRCFERR
jgi:hypothetical protein